MWKSGIDILNQGCSLYWNINTSNHARPGARGVGFLDLKEMSLPLCPRLLADKHWVLAPCWVSHRPARSALLVQCYNSVSGQWSPNTTCVDCRLMSLIKKGPITHYHRFHQQIIVFHMVISILHRSDTHPLTSNKSRTYILQPVIKLFMTSHIALSDCAAIYSGCHNIVIWNNKPEANVMTISFCHD